MSSQHSKQLNILLMAPLLVFLVLSGLPDDVQGRINTAGCTAKLNNCTEMVRPYLHDLRYMFPTNLRDVDQMCKMWSQFVDCVRRYVTSCFTEERRSKFNTAVENSVDTVHAICSSDSVQREYLNNAECFRKVSVEKCGRQYNQLIEFVANPKAHDDHICCAYGQFKECVNEPLLRECGHRSRNLMDHSMGFLITRCGQKFSSQVERCPTPSPMKVTTSNQVDTFTSLNDVSQRPRADRSHNPASSTQPSRIGLYTMAPEHQSNPSLGFSVYQSKATALFALLRTCICLLLK